MAIHSDDMGLVFGIVGDVVSFLSFLDPVPKFYRVYKWKTTEGLESVPYIGALFSAMIWLFYAYVKTGEMPLLAANAFGCVVETIYLTIYIIYCPKKDRIFTFRLILLLNFGGFCVIVLSTYFLAEGEASRVKLLGRICDVRVAIRKKSAQCLPLVRFPVMKIMAAITWFLYGLALKDIFVIIPNAVGLWVGIVQMVMHTMFTKNKNNGGEDQEKLEMVIIEIEEEKPQAVQREEEGEDRPEQEKGKIVVEVDGAYSHLNGKAACGGIIKDDRKCVVEAFALKLFSGNKLTADLWGCLMGLKRAWDKGYRDVILSSDSKEAFKLIDSDVRETHEEWELLMEINEMVGRQWNMVTQLTTREQNGAADSLAKKALDGAFGLQILGPSAMHAYLKFEP